MYIIIISNITRPVTIRAAYVPCSTCADCVPCSTCVDYVPCSTCVDYVPCSTCVDYVLCSPCVVASCMRYRSVFCRICILAVMSVRGESLHQTDDVTDDVNDGKIKISSTKMMKGK